MVPMMRECTNCLKMLPLETFNKHPKGKFGRTEQCSTCLNQKQQRYRTRLKEDPSLYQGRQKGKVTQGMIRLLSDGRWHAKHEIEEIGDMVNMRNLRKTGFIIDKRWDSEERAFFYRMVLE